MMDTDKPIAYMRRWYFDGEKPAKERNANGRMAWPPKFRLMPTSTTKCFPDDVPLYAKREGE